MKISDDKIMSIKNNLFYRSRDAISDFYSFPWHQYKGKIDTDKINSSQALGIDFWGCLKLSRYKTELINMLFNKDNYDWELEFEYSDRSLLSEKISTQIDVLITSKNNILVIESKFFENDGGKCSQIKGKNGISQCNGKYEIQINPINNIESRCALSGKGIKYWDYIDKLTYYNKDNDYNPCPFKNGEYQWMRNICFTEALTKTKQFKAESYLVYLKSDKCPISKKVDNDTFLGELKGKIKDKNALKPISYNELILKCISFLDIDIVEKNIWVELERWITNKEKTI